MRYRHGSRAFTMFLSLLAILGGCAHKLPRVACDEKLQPINQPAPVSHNGGTNPAPTAAPSVGPEKAP
jgi:hypothetical protein